MVIRAYKPEDCRAIAELFYHTVHVVNAGDYTEEQLNVWADGKVDLEAWNRSFLEHDTLVAEMNGIITGFGDMDSTGYLDRLYVHHEYQDMGIASVICETLEARSSASRFMTHASITAKPFFEKRGYQVIKAQEVVRAGVTLRNYVMEKTKELEKYEQ